MRSNSKWCMSAQHTDCTVYTYSVSELGPASALLKAVLPAQEGGRMPPFPEARLDHAQWFSPLGSSASRIMPSPSPNSTTTHSASSNGSSLRSSPSGKQQPSEGLAPVTDIADVKVTDNVADEHAGSGVVAGHGNISPKERGTFWSAHPELSSNAVPGRSPAAPLVSTPLHPGWHVAQDATNRNTGSAERGSGKISAEAAADPFGLFHAGAMQVTALGGHPLAVPSKAFPAATAGVLVADLDMQQQKLSAAQPTHSRGNGVSMAGALQHASHSTLPAAAPATSNQQPGLIALSQQVWDTLFDWQQVQVCNEPAAQLT